MNTRNIRFRSNRIRDIAALFHEELDVLYGAGEVEVFFEMLCEAFLGWDKVRLMMSKERTIDQSDLLRFHWALEDLRGERPIQHIIGYTDFCGCRIEVGSDVLIPRPETEILCKEVLSRINTLKAPRILDLCTGSGCIAWSLSLSIQGSDVVGTDISKDALEVARSQFSEGNSPSFYVGDIFSYPQGYGRKAFDIIVSNPPYILPQEKPSMRRNVLDYEPHLALFAPGDDPLSAYRAIAHWAKVLLSPEGFGIVEINEHLSAETAEVFRSEGFENVSSLPDFYDKSRFVLFSNRP